METPNLISTESQSINSSGRRSSVSSSPEFEFWNIRDPSFPQHDLLLSADELFAGGVLLPLDHLLLPDSDPAPNPDSLGPHPPIPDPDPDPSTGPEITAASPPGLSSSKRWRDIFKKSEKRAGDDKEKEKKRERNKGGGGPSSAELNINLWPFSRSRSAGNGGVRPKSAAGGGLVSRKVSSAPCSRSNSAGESKSRKWPNSPSRTGVHLGRSSPVWQVRRGARNSEAPVRNVSTAKGVKKETAMDSRRSKAQAPSSAASSAAAAAAAAGGGAKARVLNLNVPMCIGYRHHLSCRNDEKGDLAAENGGRSGGAPVDGAGDGGRGSSFFNLRGLFAKKVY